MNPGFSCIYLYVLLVVALSLPCADGVSSYQMFGLQKYTKPESVQPYAPVPLIVAVGDSLTAWGQSIWPADHPTQMGTGWVAQLGHSFRQKADVVARGFPGYDTRCALAALPAALGGLGNSKLTVFIIFFGTNDSKHPGDTKVKGDDFKRNLKRICSVGRKTKNNAKCVFVTPPPVLDTASNTNVFKNNETRAYSKYVREVGEETGYPVIDLNTDMTKYAFKKGGGGIGKYLIKDGVHLNDQGNKFLARLIYGRLLKYYPGLRPKRQGAWFPTFGDIIDQLDKEEGKEGTN